MSFSSSLRIIVTGLVGLYPVGGVAWDYLQYIVGLAKLGHKVYYYEDTWTWPYHPLKKEYTTDGNYSARYIADFFKYYAPELNDKWYYFHLHKTSFGMNKTTFEEIAKTADLFLNISGACLIPDQLSADCVKVFLDTDPGYNQIVFSERFSWSENVDKWCSEVMAHDQHFTYAENIHRSNCMIPKLDFDWKTTRMPIVMSLWENNTPITRAEKMPWTTVMTWNAFKGPLIYEGVEYKSKGSEFEKLIELPRYVSLPIKVAVGGLNAPLKRLESYGWQVVDGPTLSVTPQQYQQFIVNSRAEFSVAKNVYTALKTGWFSCRSACYLATGKPVVVQDTGFSSVLPVGEGIVPFTSLAEAVAAIEEVESNYERHAKAARTIAQEYFDSHKVLTKLIEEALSSSPKIS